MNEEISGLIVGPDGRWRCSWHGDQPDYRDYHDNEWGRPVKDDRRLFEKICLEGFQSGLSWLTILRKRENFRRAFADFEFELIATFGSDDIARLMSDAGIVRHRGKIVSTINNAQRAIELVRSEGSLAAYFWQWEPGSELRPTSFDHATMKTIAHTSFSALLSKDLKRRGWSFVGPTTVYAFMQAMGLVNDHLEGCFCRQEVEKARQAFTRPATA